MELQSTDTCMRFRIPLFFVSSGPVMSCDWLSDGQKLVTASWDHTAKLWDFKSAQVILSLEGTDMY